MRLLTKGHYHYNYSDVSNLTPSAMTAARPKRRASFCQGRYLQEGISAFKSSLKDSVRYMAEEDYEVGILPLSSALEVSRESHEFDCYGIFMANPQDKLKLFALLILRVEQQQPTSPITFYLKGIRPAVLSTMNTTLDG